MFPCKPCSKMVSLKTRWFLANGWKPIYNHYCFKKSINQIKSSWLISVDTIDFALQKPCSKNGFFYMKHDGFQGKWLGTRFSQFQNGTQEVQRNDKIWMVSVYGVFFLYIWSWLLRWCHVGSMEHHVARERDPACMIASTVCPKSPPFKFHPSTADNWTHKL